MGSYAEFQGMHSTQPATEWRKILAHGASRGNTWTGALLSPIGAKDPSRLLLSPRWGLLETHAVTPRLTPWAKF